jgi:hypothetical protein
VNAQAYQPLSLVRLAQLLAAAGETESWRLVAEFLEDYRWEPVESRATLIEAEPTSTGDDRWDVFLAALAEHLETAGAAPSWSGWPRG